jgi:hypothetical protein
MEDDPKSSDISNSGVQEDGNLQRSKRGYEMKL